MTTDQESFGDLLRRYRTARGLTQAELAEVAGLSQRAVSDLERGLRRAPYAHTVERLIGAMQLGSAERAALQAARRARLLPRQQPTSLPLSEELRLPVTGSSAASESSLP